MHFMRNVCAKLYIFAVNNNNNRLTMNNMPAVTKNLLIINILFFAGRYVAQRYGIDLDDILGLHFFLANDFHAYQLFTYMFMHAGFEHLFFNMFAVWMFGRIMEQTMGGNRFLFYYITCGLGAGLTQEIVQFIQYYYMGLGAYDDVNLGGIIMNTGDYLNRWTTVGASGAVYGILLSFGMTFPNERMFIFPLPVPIKAKYFVVGYAVIELLSAMGRSNDGVAHFAHLGGMLVGFLLLLYWRNGGGRSNNYGGGYYNRGGWNSKNQFGNWFQGLKSQFQKKKKPHVTIQQGGKFGSEMDFNRRKQEEQAEIDRILDKIKAKGYGSLTEEEKIKIFNAGNK